MPLNTKSIGQRSVPASPIVTANGGYTLPQQSFVPNPATRPLSGRGMIPAGNGGHTGNPGFINAAHVDSSQLPGATLGSAVGFTTQTAQIQINPQS